MFEATESQWSFLNVLVEERVLTLKELQYLDDVIMGRRNTTTALLIDWLQRRPKNERYQVDPGVYKHAADLYLVREAMKTSRKYATRLVTQAGIYEWRYVPGAISELSARDRVPPAMQEDILAAYPPKKRNL
jgi:hypothetical protein